MIILGIDLSSDWRKTGVCRMRWAEGGGTVEHITAGVQHEDIPELARDADKVAVDAPLGWPDDFVRAVEAHRRGSESWEASTVNLRLRATDRYVAANASITPLSVSANLIGVTAMHAARLLVTLQRQGWNCARDGSGKIVEVYPAAALRRWRLPAKKYKKAKGCSLRGEILEGLVNRSGVQIAEEHRGVCREKDDALDAFIAALVGRAFVLELCDAVEDGLRERAKREGWIAIPEPGSLERLRD